MQHPLNCFSASYKYWGLYLSGWFWVRSLLFWNTLFSAVTV